MRWVVVAVKNFDEPMDYQFRRLIPPEPTGKDLSAPPATGRALAREDCPAKDLPDLTAHGRGSRNGGRRK